MEENNLVSENMNLVYRILHKHYPTYVYDEDMVQCAMLGLCKAASTYDPTKSKFPTYAWRVIVNEIRTELKNRNLQPKQVSLSHIVSDDGETTLTLEDVLEGSTDVDYYDCDGFFSTLNPLQRRVAELLQQGLTQGQIATILGQTRSNISLHIRHIRLKWRKFNEH